MKIGKHTFIGIRDTVARGLHTVNKHAKPVLEVVGALGSIAEAANPSPIVVLGSLSRAASGLETWATPSTRKMMASSPFPPGIIREEIMRRLKESSPIQVGDGFHGRIGEDDVFIKEHKNMMYTHGEEAQCRVYRKISESLPRGLQVTRAFGNAPEPLVVDVLSSTGMPSKRAAQILQSVRSVLAVSDESRCILLHGKPGVGKSQMALWLAHQLSEVRVMAMNNLALRSTYGVDGLIPADVGVIDDIDKVNPDLHYFEKLRNRFKILILTANNAADDRAVDGALARPGRIDESYEITDIGVHIAPVAPFDKLSADDWERVRLWPSAALNEVRLRLLARPLDEVYLEEIEARLDKRCLSVKAQ